MNKKIMRNVLNAVLLLGVVCGCASTGVKEYTEWKTIEGKKGGVILLDPMMQEFLASPSPNPTQRSLDMMLARVTRIRLADAGMSGDKLIPFNAVEGNEVKYFLDTQDRGQISEFQELLKIREDIDTMGHCMCLGWPTFEFYEGGQVIARVGMHHGVRVRWNAWKWDAALQDNIAVLDWLVNNGAPQPKASYEADLSYVAERERKYQVWLDAMPIFLRARWDEINWSVGPPMEPTIETIGDLNKIMDAAFSDPEEKALILFEWYGHGEGQWSGYPVHETVAEELLLRVKITDIINAIENAELTKAQIEGIARFFCMTDSDSLQKSIELVPESVKSSIYRHVLSQKNEDKRIRMEKSLLFRAANQPKG